MNESADLSRAAPPDEYVETNYTTAQLARLAAEWWRDHQTSTLPGEEGGYTVFTLDFYDGCKYFGYTNESIQERVATLGSNIGPWQPSQFVMEHASDQVPYVVRCIASNLTKQAAKELREFLVALAPEEDLRDHGPATRANKCWIPK